MRRPWVKVLLGVLVLFIAVIVIVPFFVNGEALRPTVEAKLSSALGRQVTLGSLSFSLLSGSLVAKNIAIADDPAFSTSPFIRAKQLNVGVQVMPLLFSHQVNITRLVIDTPAIQLIQNQAGKWNYSSIGGGTPHTETSSAHPQPTGGTHARPEGGSANPQPAPQSAQPSARPDLTVGELQIKNGSATVSSVPPTARPFVYSNVNLTVKNFSFNSSFPFDLTATLPANGSLKLTGTAGPIPASDASETPFQANLHITGLNPVAAGLIEPSQGISGVVDVDAQTTSNGTVQTSTGKIKADHLQLARTGSPSPVPIDIDYTVSNDLKSRTGRVSDIAIHAGSATAHVNGTYRFTPSAVVLDLHLAAPNLPVDQIEKLLPAFGVTIPSGSSLHGGTLTANLAVTGPATATTITGPAEIDNSNLAGFDLGSKIEGLNPFGAKNGGTQIQTLKATLNSTPQTTQIQNIYGNLPQLGTATGSGTVSPSGALDFKMVATLSSSNAVGAAINQGISQGVNQVKGMLGGFLHPGGTQAASSNTNKGIPLTITGTTSSPKIRANIMSMLK
jgi:AsmA protein